MGISNLSKLIKENSKKGYRERNIEYYSNKTIAIDASMSIYQFLIAIRSEGQALGNQDNTTSHIVGMFYRTISIVESGIKPVFIFDGVPPEKKFKELLKRKERREEANIKYSLAKEEGDIEKMEMYDKRKIKLLPSHIEDCKKVFDLLKVPYFTAPSEAEAYCAFLNKTGKVYGVATEDMDALTFGAPLLLRNVSASKTKKLPIGEYNLNQILKDLELNMEEFTDLCILLGCDFCDTIKKIGPKTSFSLIKEYRSIENIIEAKNYELPEHFNYKEARFIFDEIGKGEEIEIPEINWNAIDLNEIKKYFVEENGFNEDRINKGMERYLKARNLKKQNTLDTFFQKR